MMIVLWLVEFFEPPARKHFEIRISTTAVEDFRPKAEDVLKALGIEFELLLEDVDEIRYSVSAPVDVRTRDVSDTLAAGRRPVRTSSSSGNRRNPPINYSLSSTIVAPPPPWLSGAA